MYMRLPDRVNTDYLTLAALELAAVPLVVLVTVFVLFLGGGAMQVTESLGGEFSVGTTIIDVLVQLIVLLTTLLLLAGGGAAVTGYRRFFDRADSGLDSLVLIAVPALGVLAPLLYAFLSFGTFIEPVWLFVIAVVSAHALAFRTIALYSEPVVHRRIGLLVGCAAALPVVLALVTYLTTDVFVTNDLLSSRISDAGEHLLDGLVWTALPDVRRSLLIGVPLLLTGAYVGYQSRMTDIQRGGSTQSIQLLNSPGRLFSITKILQGITRRSSSSSNGASSSSSEEQSRYQRKSNSKGRAASRPDGSGRERSDHDSARPKRRRSPHRSGDGSSSGSSRRSNSARSSSRDRSRSENQSESTGSRNPGDRPSNSRSGNAGNKSEGKSATGGSSRSKSSSERSSAGRSTDGSSGEEDASTGSDTRIFTDDFGEYGGDSEADAACPSCDKEIPTDGVYEFCPFCGQDL